MDKAEIRDWVQSGDNREKLNRLVKNGDKTVASMALTILKIAGEKDDGDET